MGICSSSCCGGRARDGLYEPVLADSEREAVADLLQYLENRGETDFFSGEPLRALSTLVFSENIDLQRSASLTFAEITERDVREVDRDTLEPILFLLQSPDIEVQRAASAALGNLAVDTENKVLIVQLGGLTPLIRQMMSPNVEVQCNAVGCITNLATHEENKAKIARSGALGPLTRLAKSRDMRVQRNATGALLNMTHSGMFVYGNGNGNDMLTRVDENRQQLVNAGAIPVLVQLLSSPDVDVQYYCTTALSNIAVDASNRRKLAQSEPKLVQSLVNLMDSTSPKVQCQAALALRNLASDEKYQLDIVRANGLHPLLRLLQSSYLPLILSAVACIRNISIHPLNESPIIETNFLKPLVDLLGSTDNEEIQCHAISTLRNLAASSDRNKALVLDAGAVQKCKQLVLDVPITVQSEMTAAIAVLALSDDLKSHLLNLGVCGVLIPLTHSPSIEVQGNSAAALGNLSSKVGDYSIFVQNWTEPQGGIHGYLCRFLQSGDATFQHIAVWTLLQLFESEDKTLIGLIGKAEDIIEHIRSIANRQIEADNEFEDEDEGEVVNLAQRCLELLGQSMSKAHIEG
ncbi:vacuolar protein 8 [Fusarium proliferatum]|nr:vacuolar protein 8 [Fusarium proliferatum]